VPMDVMDVAREPEDGDVDPSCIMPALDLTERGLERVPDTHLQPQVVALDLSVNRIMRVEALRLASFGNLTTLSLRSNGLVSLEGLHVVRALRHLDVADNSVSSFKGLATLEYLATLMMGQNKVSKLGSLRALTFNAQLAVIDLRGNPVTLQAHYKCTLRTTVPDLLEFDGEFTSAQLQARRRATAAAGRVGQAQSCERATVTALAVGYGRLHALSKVKRRAAEGAVRRTETAEAMDSSKSVDAGAGEGRVGPTAANLHVAGLEGVVQDVRPSSPVPAWRRAPAIAPRARRAPGAVARGSKSAAKAQVGTSASASTSKRPSPKMRPSSASSSLQGSSTARGSSNIDAAAAVTASTGGLGGARAHPSDVACTARDVASVTSMSGGESPDVTASFCSTADDSAMLDASALGFDFHDPLDPNCSSLAHASLPSPPSPGGYLEGFLSSTDKRSRLQKQQQQRKRVQELSMPRVRREKDHAKPATAVAAGTGTGSGMGVNNRSVRIALGKEPVAVLVAVPAPESCTEVDAENDYESALCTLDCVEGASGAFVLDLSDMGTETGEQDLSLSLISGSSLGDLVSAAIAELRGDGTGDATPALSKAGRLSVDEAVEMLLEASLGGVDIGSRTGKAVGARSLDSDVLGVVPLCMDLYAELAPAPESEAESGSEQQPVHAPVLRAAWEAVHLPTNTPAATSEPRAFTAREEEATPAPAPALSDDAMRAMEEVCAAGSAALAVSHAGETPPLSPTARLLPHTPDALDMFMDAAPTSPAGQQAHKGRHCWLPPSPDSAAQDDVVGRQTTTPCGVVDLVTEHEQHGKQAPSSAKEVLQRTALPLSKPVRSIRTLKALRDMGRVMQEEEAAAVVAAAGSATLAPHAAVRTRQPASPGQWAATRLDVLVRARSLLLNAPAKSCAAARAAAPRLAAAIEGAR